jgi:hypothetical protein
MTWAPLLLADPSPNLRWLVLRELLGKPAADAEVVELALLRDQDPLLAELIAAQNDDGSWGRETGAEAAYHRIRPTADALSRLGYLGFGPEYPPLRRGASFLLDQQLADGSWPLPGNWLEREPGEAYEMVPMQTGLPLRALAMAGYAQDPRAEKGYQWLLACRLPDGAWPSGVKAGQNVFPAGYRRLAHSRFGCRSNTTFALSALAYHPGRRQNAAARRALDMLLAQETLPAYGLGLQVARHTGVEKSRGLFTYFARYDVALSLDLCWRVGANLEDPRVAAMVTFVAGLQGPYGLWEYQPYRQISRWLTFDLLRSLSRIDRQTDWFTLEPRTPFRPYPKKAGRY